MSRVDHYCIKIKDIDNHKHIIKYIPLYIEKCGSRAPFMSYRREHIRVLVIKHKYPYDNLKYKIVLSNEEEENFFETISSIGVQKCPE